MHNQSSVWITVARIVHTSRSSAPKMGTNPVVDTQIVPIYAHPSLPPTALSWPDKYQCVLVRKCI